MKIAGRHFPSSDLELTATIGVDAPEITAHFRDPGGNVLGIYQHPVK